MGTAAYERYLLVLCVVFTISMIGTKADGFSQEKVKSKRSAAALPTWPPVGGILGNFTRAAVAADDGICSEIGRNTLLKGGNAVDAMIATVLCIGVVDSRSSGLGGGHIATIYNKTTKSCLIIDAREKAPAAAAEDMYVNKSGSSLGGWLAIGVAGEIHGLYTAYKLASSGKIPWRDLVTPAADLCKHGYPITGSLAKGIKVIAETHFFKDDTIKNMFTNNKTGKLYAEGEIITRPALAATLYALADAEDPIEWFYNSNLTKTMAAEFQQNGGIITEKDFNEYKAKYGKERPVITLKLGARLVACGPPPPSSSSVTMAMLNIMQGFNISQSKLQDPDFQMETYHRLIEAMKLAYASRLKLGDMDFVDSALKLSQEITSPEYGDFARNLITKRSHDSCYYTQERITGVEDHGTANVAVLDEEGNAVVITTTVNFYFGSGTFSESTGIIWNDEMEDFSTPGVANAAGYAPSPANFIRPGKRPASSMSPIVVYDPETGNVKIAVGCAGGSHIPSTVAQVLMRLLWFGQDVQAAVGSPRFHNQFSPFQTEYESGFPKVLMQNLTDRGHEFMPYFTFLVSATAIHRGDDGRVYANSDYRKEGAYAAGY